MGERVFSISAREDGGEENAMGWMGLLLRKGRLEKDWSQEGLCKGICAVSYLSKIEQGKVEPSPEIMKLLFVRLGLAWQGEDAARQTAEWIERAYDALFSMEEDAWEELWRQMGDGRESMCCGPGMIDFLLLESWEKKAQDPFLQECQEWMSPRQRALWLTEQGRCQEALSLQGDGWFHFIAGRDCYQKGDYVQARALLEKGFALAAEECRPRLMLECKLFLGNCCSDTGRYEDMLSHYRGARRLAQALRDDNAMRGIRYNIASTDLFFGRVEEALDYFENISEPTAMDLHKRAVCLEKLGRRDQARAALDQARQAPAFFPNRELTDDMCQLVRYRLEHPEYLKDAAYGEMLLRIFETLRRELPMGYVLFHLPWVEEWYVANRQYRQAWQLMRDFPEYRH